LPQLAPCASTSPSAHIHDNLGDKDAHLAPHDGSIDWPAALKLFRSLPGGEISADAGTKRKKPARTRHAYPTRSPPPQNPRPPEQDLQAL